VGHRTVVQYHLYSNLQCHLHCGHLIHHQSLLPLPLYLLLNEEKFADFVAVVVVVVVMADEQVLEYCFVHVHANVSYRRDE